MKTETMRIIDRYVGTPLCIVLAWLSGLLVRKPKSDTVVICKFFGIGSMCLSYPLIYELKKQGVRVVYLTFTSNKPMVNFLGVDRCLTINPKSILTFGFDVFRVIWQLRQIRPTGFLNLEFFSQFAAIMSVLSGAPVRAGFHILHLSVGKLYTHKINLNVYRSVSENYLNVGLLSRLIPSFEAPEIYPNTFHSPAITKLPLDILKRNILINTESSDTIWELKSWGNHKWSRLIELLQVKYPDHSLVLIGTSSVEEAHKEIIAGLKQNTNVVNAAGCTSFDEVVNLIKGTDLLISVDSGPQHISALLKRPTIVLFGPETPVLFGHQLPWVRSIHKNLMCSPCLAIYGAKKSVLDCQDNQCMKQIEPADVMTFVTEFLPIADTNLSHKTAKIG